MIGLDALARPSGTFLMVAMDQRESLRTMLADRRLGPIEDASLVEFKLAVARELGPLASGFLIDRHYAFDAIVRERLLPASCGLILAADALQQPPGGVVEDTDLDPGIDSAEAAHAGVVALKLLVIWRDDDARPRRLETARRFVDLAHAHGLLSVLEGVVRGPEGFEREAASAASLRKHRNRWEREHRNRWRDAAIVTAARELSSVGPSLYKCEVPLRGRGEHTEIERRCREIDAAVGCPWVVLSQGVEPEDFPPAVEAACRGGASGMLAGRAIWSAAVGEDDPTAKLRSVSVPRLRELAAIVDAHGRPWTDR